MALFVEIVNSKTRDVHWVCKEPNANLLVDKPMAPEYRELLHDFVDVPGVLAEVDNVIVDLLYGLVAKHPRDGVLFQLRLVEYHPNASLAEIYIVRARWPMDMGV
jgi:hypothetical protein